MKVYKSSRQVLMNLSEDQIRKVKEALTFNNPAYQSAKRYSRSKYISIPPYLEYFNEGVHRDREGKKRYLSVPVGVNLEKLLGVPVKDIADNRVVQNVEYPPFVFTLREDQESAKSAYIHSQKKEQFSKSLIQLPTGKGKTILALNIACTLKQRTLVLVHKDDLVTGWQNDIEDCFGGKLEPGLVKAKKRNVGKQITIATVQTLSRMSEEELSSYLDKFGLVIQDECHHVGLNIFNVIDKFQSRYKLGLTATPVRGDGLDFVFDLFFGGIVFKSEYTAEDTDILPVEVKVKESKAVYEPFLYENQVFNKRDFIEEELPDKLVLLRDLSYEDRPRVPFLVIDDVLVSNKKHMIGVCKDIISEYRKGHSCIAFFTQKEHIVSYYRYLKLFVPEDTILLYYGDNKEKSDVMIEKAESRKCLITLATYAKATEGTNVKSWECGFLVSSVNSEKNVEQAVGRIRRRKEGKINPALLYDYRFSDSYSISAHGKTRDKVYRKLKFNITGKRKSDKKSGGLFSRGYR